MDERAYIVSRMLEHKIAIMENNDQNTMFITLGALKEILALLKEQETIIDRYRKADGFLAAHGWKWDGGEVNECNDL